MTWLIFDDTLIKLKRDVNPDLYRAIYSVTRKWRNEIKQRP